MQIKLNLLPVNGESHSPKTLICVTYVTRGIKQVVCVTERCSLTCNRWVSCDHGYQHRYPQKHCTLAVSVHKSLEHHHQTHSGDETCHSTAGVGSRHFIQLRREESFRRDDQKFFFGRGLLRDARFLLLRFKASPSTTCCPSREWLMETKEQQCDNQNKGNTLTSSLRLIAHQVKINTHCNRAVEV